MRQQRAIVLASLGFTASLAGAVPLALVALGQGFGPVSLRSAHPALAAGPPIVLPPVVARPHPRARPAGVVERHTIIPAKGTIIPAAGATVAVPATRVVVAPAAPAVGRVPQRPQEAAPRSSERHRARPSARATTRIAHVPAAPPQIPPVQPAPTASIAAVQGAPDDKAVRKSLKAQQKAQKQQQKLARRAGNPVKAPAAQRTPGGPRRGRR